MKNLIAILFVAFTIAASAQNGKARFGIPPAGDNTGSQTTYQWISPALKLGVTADSLKLYNNASYCYVQAVVDSNTYITANTAGARLWDRILISLSGSGVIANPGSHLHDTVYFSTGFTPTGGNTYLICDSAKVAVAEFFFNGSKFVEISQSKQ